MIDQNKYLNTFIGDYLIKSKEQSISFYLNREREMFLYIELNQRMRLRGTVSGRHVDNCETMDSSLRSSQCVGCDYIMSWCYHHRSAHPNSKIKCPSAD